MPQETQAFHLLQALGAFSHRTVVVSPELMVLAAPAPAVPEGAPDPVGKSCHQVFFGREAPCEDCGVLEVLRTGRPTLRHVLIRENDQQKAYHRHVLPIREQGRITAVAVLDLDPDYFGGLDKDVVGAHGFLKNLIQSSVDGIIASDMKGRILIFNEAASRMTGYTEDEATARIDIRDIYPGDGAREVMRHLRGEHHGGKGKLKSFRTELQRKNGTTFPIELSASVVYECGVETATVGFFYDLREKLRMERELAEAQLQLLQAEKMSSLGRLSAGVAHQINNPLGSIVLYAHILLEEYGLGPEAQADVRRIVDDAQRCQTIVQELLDFARQSRLDIRPQDINRALARTIFLLEGQPLFRDLRIVQEFDPDLPLVPADLQQLNHVFLNLVLNAADAMEGRGTLTLKTRVSGNGRYVQVEVTDTGPGIPGAILPRIFDPFFTTKEEGRGTGLGLSVAYGVVQNHGGRLTVCSAPGEGSAFVMELPLVPDAGTERRP